MAYRISAGLISDSIRIFDPTPTCPNPGVTLQVAPINTNNLQSVDYGNGLFVAVGSNEGIYTSTDGTSWTQRESGNSYLQDVKYNGVNQWMAVGSLGTILYSSDAFTWTRVSTGAGVELQAVAGNGNIWVATGQNGTIITSPDGNNWTPRSSGATSHVFFVRWFDDQFIAGDRDGNVLVSPDGINWTNKPALPVTVQVRWIDRDENGWILVGNNLTMLRSIDLETWVQVDLGATEGFFSNVLKGDHMWIAAGRGNNGGGFIYTSADGENWTYQNASQIMWVAGLAYDTNTQRWVVVGTEGAASVLTGIQECG
jgi:hypothetical protein